MKIYQIIATSAMAALVLAGCNKETETPATPDPDAGLKEVTISIHGAKMTKGQATPVDEWGTAAADISKYDVVFLGSPNWWGTITPQVSSFLENYDLSGKTVIPFITHGGGGVQNTVRDMTAQCKGCNVNQEAWVGYGSRTFGIGGWLEDLGFAK